MLISRHPRLFAPGPTPVPEAVRLAMAAPQVHHRSPAFLAVLADVRKKLQWAFGTTQPVMMLSGTGTLGMEAAVVNALSAEDTAIYVNGGRFGRRWGDLLHAYGVRGVPIEVPLGQAVDPLDVENALKAHPEAKAVFCQTCETSTGVRHPVEALAALTREKERCLLVVDAITAAGLDEVGMDAYGFDIVLGASQKGFMMPPGLVFVAMSAKAWRANDEARLPRFYTDLGREAAMAHQGHTSWTTPTSLVLGLRAALEMMQAEGLDEISRRHRILSQACQAAVQALGCALFANKPAIGLTACTPPPGMEAREISQRLARNHAMTIGGGLETMAGKLLRLAHMGYVDGHDMLGLIGALGEVLVSLGHPCDPSAGLDAAQKILAAA